jgi:hypothetical protein
VENEFSAERWNGSWVSDTEYVYRNRAGALAIFSVVNGRSDVIVPANVMEEPRVFQFWLSPDLVRYFVLRRLYIFLIKTRKNALKRKGASCYGTYENFCVL